MVILGSTGSIGVNALKLAREHGVKIEALSGNKNVSLLNQQIREFRPRYVGLCGGDVGLLEPLDSIVFSGEDAIIDMLKMCESERILNAIVGFAGLKASLYAIENDKYLILANKESLVIAGGVIYKTLRVGCGVEGAECENEN